LIVFPKLPGLLIYFAVPTRLLNGISVRSGLWTMETFNVPGLMFLPVPALFPCLPVLLDMVLGDMLIVPLMPAPAMLAIVPSPV
jgi:hypothetical protein